MITNRKLFMGVLPRNTVAMTMCTFLYEACLKSKDTELLNMYSIFNLQKRHCE